MSAAPTVLMFIVVTVGLCGGLMLLCAVISRFTQRDKQRRKQLEILEEALKRGDMNGEIRREVVEMLKSSQPRRFSWWHGMFSLGWLGLFAGASVLMFGDRHLERAGWITVVASFALVTLPLALKELDARRAPDRSAS